jgi:hypothetical protein
MRPSGCAVTFLHCYGDILRTLCAARGQWGMFISNGRDSAADIRHAAPYLTAEQAFELSAAGTGEAYLFFDPEEECERAFWSTVGDDGPTKTNPYNGPARVFACTCGPDGVLRHENT